jgi:hypothetical protein
MSIDMTCFDVDMPWFAYDKNGLVAILWTGPFTFLPKQLVENGTIEQCELAYEQYLRLPTRSSVSPLTLCLEDGRAAKELTSGSIQMIHDGGFRGSYVYCNGGWPPNQFKYLKMANVEYPIRVEELPEEIRRLSCIVKLSRVDFVRTTSSTKL